MTKLPPLWSLQKLVFCNSDLDKLSDVRVFRQSQARLAIRIWPEYVRWMNLSSVCLRRSGCLYMYTLLPEAALSPEVTSSAPSYRGEARQHLGLDLVDLEAKSHFRIREGYNQKCGVVENEYL